jgi:hypothetical protein
MKSSSPGPDNIAKEDLISAGKPYLENARKQLLRATLPQGESLVFKKRSHNGNYRLIESLTSLSDISCCNSETNRGFCGKAALAILLLLSQREGLPSGCQGSIFTVSKRL